MFINAHKVTHAEDQSSTTSNGSCMNSMKLIKPENHCFKTPCSIIVIRVSQVGLLETASIDISQAYPKGR